MIGRRARPLEPALAVQPRVGDAAEERRQPRHLVEDLGRAAVVELAADVQAEPPRDAPRQLGGDPPVRPRLAERRQRRPHALHAALGVGERAFLLGERRRRQEHVGPLGRLVHEQVLHDQEVELADRLLGVVQVGLGEQRVLADDVHRPDLAVEAALDHLGHDEAGAAGRPHAPGAPRTAPSVSGA